MTTPIALVTLDGVLVNDRKFNAPANPGEYTSALAAVPRVIEPPTPAPFGHRNNQIHLFDDLGLYLIEHHETRLVLSVCFVLWLEESPFKPARECSISLKAGDVQVIPGITPRELASGEISFKGPELGLWIAERDEVSICFNALGMKSRKSGRRSKQLRVGNLSVGFNARAGYAKS